MPKYPIYLDPGNPGSGIPPHVKEHSAIDLDNPAPGVGGANYWLKPVRYASTGPISNMSTDLDNGSTLDGAVLATGHHILVKDQDSIDPSQNGIYIVQASGAPVRRSDFASPGSSNIGSTVYVEKGSFNEGTYWTCVAAPGLDENYWRNAVRPGGWRADDANQSYGPGDTTLNTVASIALKETEWEDVILEFLVAGTFTNNTGATRTFRWLLALDGQTIFDETSGGLNSTASTREWGLRCKLIPTSTGIWLLDASGMITIAPATPFAATPHAQDFRLLKRWAPGTPPSGDATLTFQVQGQSGAGMSYTKRGHALLKLVQAQETGL